MNIFEQKNVQLVTEFDRYIIQNPEFAEAIPNGALVVMEMEGDDAFNEWSHRMAQQQAEMGQPVVYVRIKKLRQVQSRIEELEIEA
ncbi:MAG: hypothetical protein ONB44_02280 [candidate division KSB1 bacterium]|nr:hypothetical protein [candidate division KSB1 bacterium]MDZ7300951.1 hypothetical protein [candidate division KSB1 bacterium]MDZ7310371.1 hypothetical protein [candidate division KSB1 bacterium]